MFVDAIEIVIFQASPFTNGCEVCTVQVARVLMPPLLSSPLFPSPPLLQPLPSVRAAAFRLFGSLARFSDGPSRGPFLEQVQTNFVSLLLHLNEEDPFVIAVSEQAHCHGVTTTAVLLCGRLSSCL